jgi:hypothetical protein
MTKIRPGAPVTRETDVFERTDALVVSLYPKYLTIRLKGRRGKPVELGYGHLLDISQDLLNLRKRMAVKTVFRPGLKKGA